MLQLYRHYEGKRRQDGTDGQKRQVVTTTSIPAILSDEGVEVEKAQAIRFGTGAIGVTPSPKTQVATTTQTFV
jgi:hypothetical protein